MATTILYNSVDPFSAVASIPLVSKDVQMIRFGSRWGQVHNIVLRGLITGQCLQYSGYLSRKDTLLSGFSKDFQALEIYDDALLVKKYDTVKIAGIDFDDSTYANGLIPYTIALEAYPQNYFSGQYGILNPIEEISFQESEDGKIKLNHVVSAKGFCTTGGSTNNALENARSWVSARTGWSSQILPAFITGASNGFCLQTLAENYDRLNSSYEVIESYVGDIFGDMSQGLLRYTTDYSSGIADGVSTMRLEGELKGCKYQNLTALRSKYSSFNAFTQALNQYKRITNQTDLNSLPVVKSVAEDSTQKVISFGYTYSNDSRPQINIVYSIEYSYDFEADVVSASISATVSSKAVYDASKWADVLDVANRINLYSLVVPGYNSYVNQVAPHLNSFPLNSVPKTSSRSDNQFACIVSLSATFSNEPLAPNGLDAFSSTISFSPSLHKYIAAPILDGVGEYYIFDLGYVSRGAVDISVQGLGSEATSPAATLAILKTQVKNLNADYFRGAKMVLENQNYTTGNAGFGKQSSVSASFSAESSEFTL